MTIKFMLPNKRDLGNHFANDHVVCKMVRLFCFFWSVSGVPGLFWPVTDDVLLLLPLDDDMMALSACWICCLHICFIGFSKGRQSVAVICWSSCGYETAAAGVADATAAKTNLHKNPQNCGLKLHSDRQTDGRTDIWTDRSSYHPHTLRDIHTSL